MSYAAVNVNGSVTTLATWNGVAEEYAPTSYDFAPFTEETLSFGTTDVVGVALLLDQVIGDVTVELYDGVTLIDSATVTPESHSWTWFPLTAPSGTYDLKIIGDGDIAKVGTDVLYLLVNSSTPPDLTTLLESILYIIGTSLVLDITTNEQIEELHIAGDLTLATTSSETFKLAATKIVIYDNGTLTLIPHSSSTLDCDIQTIDNFGTLTATGASKRTISNLTSQAISGSTALNIDASTNWVIGDALVLTPTDNYNESEQVLISSISGTIGVSATAFDHSEHAQVINITKSIMIDGPSIEGTGAFNFSNVLITNCTINIDDNLTLSESVIVGNVSANNATITNSYIEGNLNLLDSTLDGSVNSIGEADLINTTTDNSSFSGSLADAAVVVNGGIFNDNKVYANSAGGVKLNGSISINTLLTFNNQNGLISNTIGPASIIIYGWEAFDNLDNHFLISSNFTGFMELSNLNFINNGITGSAIRFAANCWEVDILNSDLGSTGSSYLYGDISANADLIIQVNCQNCKFSANPVTTVTQSNIRHTSYIGSDRHNQISGVYQRWQQHGKTEIDVTRYTTPTISQKITPNNSNRVEISNLQTYVQEDDELYVSVLIRKSEDYNGDQPQLVMKANPAIGYNTDLVIGEASFENGVWELVNGQLPPATASGIAYLAVKTNGTVGYINIDDFTSSKVNVPDGAMAISHRGMPIARSGNVRTSSNLAFYSGIFTSRCFISNLNSPRTLLLGYSQSNSVIEIISVHITNTNIRYHEQVNFKLLKLTNPGLAKGTAINGWSQDGAVLSQATWVKDLIIEPAAYSPDPYHAEGVLNTNGYHYTRENPRIKVSPNSGIGIYFDSTPQLPFNCEVVVNFRQIGG